MEYDPLIIQARKSLPKHLRIVSGISRIAERLSELHSQILVGRAPHTVVVIAGMDLLLRTAEKTTVDSAFVTETPDYLGIRNRKNNTTHSTSTSTDIPTMMRTLLTKGPLTGCHSVVIVSSSSAYAQCKLPDVFRHKILYRTSAHDASSLMIPAAQAIRYASLDDNQYRYTNGLDQGTYRPYFHPGLTWDNMTMEGNGQVHVAEEIEEDDYLI